MKILKPATRLAAICIGIIALAAIICFLFSQYLRLDKPVPYEVHGAYPIYNQGEYGSLNEDIFRIPYLASRTGANSQITDIRFKELAALKSSHNTYYTGDDSGIFLQNTLSLSLGQDEDVAGIKEPITLTSATVTYSDGESENTVLGEIILYPKTLEGEGAIEIDEGVTEVKGQRILQGKVNQAIRLQSAVCIPDYNGRELMFNGAEFDNVKGTLLKKGQQLQIEVNVKETPWIIDEPAVKVVYQTEDGKEHTQILGSFTKDEYTEPGFLQNLRYLKERGRLQ